MLCCIFQACYLWLIAYPANFVVAMVFPYYWRHAVSSSNNFMHGGH